MSHPELVGDLQERLRLRVGLAEILGATAGPVTETPWWAEHASLVADLASSLDAVGGTREIADVAGDHAGLISDLAGAIDTQSGLTKVMGSTGVPPPEAAGVPAISDVERIRLLFGQPQRHLEVAMKDLESIRDNLTRAGGRSHADLPERLAACRTLLGGLQPAGEEDRPAEAPARTRVATTGVGPVSAAVIAPDGTWLAANDGGQLKIWDRRGTFLRQIDSAYNPSALAVSRDGGALVTIRDGHTVEVWNTSTGSRLRAFEVSVDAGGRWISPGAHPPVVTPDGRWMAAVTPGPVLIWDLHTGAPYRQISRLMHLPVALTGTYLAAVETDGHLRTRDLTTGGNLHGDLGDGSLFDRLVFSPDGGLLAGFAVDGRVVLWNVAESVVLATVWLAVNSVQRAAVAPDGSWIAILFDEEDANGLRWRRARICHTATGGLWITLPRTRTPGEDLYAAPDATWLAVRSPEERNPRITAGHRRPAHPRATDRPPDGRGDRRHPPPVRRGRA